MATPSLPADLPSAVRVLLGASLTLLVRADDAAERATGTLRERSSALRELLPAPRRSYDEL